MPRKRQQVNGFCFDFMVRCKGIIKSRLGRDSEREEGKIAGERERGPERLGGLGEVQEGGMSKEGL